MSHPTAVRPVLPATRLLLVAFSVLTFLAVIALFVLSGQTDRTFAWTIRPPLTAAFLGAGYGAGCVLVVLALRAAAWGRARVAIVTIFLFVLVTLAATLLHLDKFHFGAAGVIADGAAWFWLTVYVVIPVAMAVMLVRQARGAGSDPDDGVSLPGALRLLLVAQGVVLTGVGVALFAVPRTARTLWPWALTPLTARAVAAWLIAFGVAALVAVREDELGQLALAAVAYTVFGLLEVVALLRYTGEVRWGAPSAVVYVVVLASIPPTGAAGWLLARRARIPI